jgi:hypothetical protein
VHQPAKIDYLPLQILRSLHFAMRPEKVRSYTVAKAINESAWRPLNAYPGYVILFPSVHHSQCKQAQQPKFF